MVTTAWTMEETQNLRSIPGEIMAEEVQMASAVRYIEVCSLHMLQLGISYQSSFKFVIGKRYQESYLKDAPTDDKLRFKTIKVRGQVIIKKENLMQGVEN
ncbi:hypothetical protein Tco_0897227 [Tanacetum coccineum]